MTKRSDNSKRFTDTFVSGAKPGDKLIDYVASNCPGLHLRIQLTGTKTFVFSFRSKITGKPENKTIGHYPAVSLADAIRKVNDAWKLVEDSKPVEFTEAKKNAGEVTVADALTKYAENHLADRRSGPEILKALTVIADRHNWGARALVSLTKKEIKEVLINIKVKRGAPQAANVTQQRISTFLQWACNEDIIPFNPVRGMSAVAAQSKPRARRLSDDEIRALWKVWQNPEAHQMHRSYADAMMLQLATAARSGMIGGLKNGYLFNVPGSDEGTWGDKLPVADVPGEDMKMGRAFVTPLNSLAVDILRRRDSSARYVFPSTSTKPKDKGQPLNHQYLAFFARRLSKELGFKEGFTPHDLRRTAASLLRREGYTRDQVGMLLAHEAEGDKVMAAYDAEDRWDHLAKKREMADKLAVILKRIIFGAGAIRAVA